MGVVDRLCQSIVFGLCLGVPAVGAAAQDMPPLPKPGPEHQLFKEDEGTWDAKVEVFPGPGAAPMVSKGVEINTVGCGGLCLITDFKGEVMPGQVFHGHGTAAYDPQKKKYVGTGVDSNSMSIGHYEGSVDAAGKTLTMEGEMPSPFEPGKSVRVREVIEIKSPDQKTITTSVQGPDGSWFPLVTVNARRKK